MSAMSAICCCFGNRQEASHITKYVSLDHQRRAQSCNVSAGGHLSGEGAALGTAAILQDRSFWEAQVVALGYFALGVADYRVKLTETRMGTTTPPKSWGIDSDTLLEQYEINAGDTIGVAFDMSDEKVLRYYHNGNYLTGQDVRGVKGETWPIVSVAGGAALQLNFGAEEFAFPIPKGFDGVIAPRNLVSRGFSLHAVYFDWESPMARMSCPPN